MSLLLWFYVINQGDVTAGAKTINVTLQYKNVRDRAQCERTRAGDG